MDHQTEPEHRAEPSNQHEGHAPASGGGEGVAVPSGPAPAEAGAGPAHAADTVFGASSMEVSRRELHRMHGGDKAYKVMIDRLEGRVRDGQDLVLWDAQAWYGGDTDKVWLKTEGEGGFSGGVESAETQLLWSRAVTPWFNLQAGVRHDFRPDPERTHLVLGLHGLAPYWLEVDAALFLSHKGDLTARLEVEYDLRITQRLILQPRAEFDLSAQEVPELELGSGLTKAELGMRLRYEIRPEFGPYVGIEYERAFGETAEWKRLASEKAGDWFLTFGVRAWF
jgi:copper resistance protein B